VADKICQNLSSAIDNFSHDKVLEMASIYDMNEKDAEIAQQKASLLQTRVMALLIALFLAVAFFVIYAVIRRRQRIRLEEKNQQLRIANERAEESSRMKTKFIQQISHEIRTPLNILSGFTQVVTAEGMELDEAARHDANQQILENTDRITGLINKMLELSDASSHTVIELTDHVLAVQIASSAVEASGIEKASHLAFELMLGEGCETVALNTCQSAAIRALSLLLDNARKFTAPAEAYGQQASADEKQRVFLKLSVVDGGVQFIVEDTGIGIPAVEAERIFDEFVQLNEYYDGTGIGLTVARSLARRLGGDIQLDTTYTDGARFVMTLPILV
jgi:signal transduction histidine kinase